MTAIRQVIALAWPEAHDPTDIQIEPLQNLLPNFILVNWDMHAANSKQISPYLVINNTDWVVMLDHFIPDILDLEHGLMPPVKMIDLGICDNLPILK